MALVGAVALRRQPPRHVSITPLPAQVALDTANLGCPTDAAWSPDSRALAIVGSLFTGSNCLSGGLLNLYDMTTGKLKKQLQLDRDVLPPARASDSDIAASATVNYNHVLWSPDGHHLAVTFYVIGATQPYTAVSGLWVADASGQQAQVLVRALSTNYPAATEWFVGGGPLPSTQPGPALSYTWGANSALRSDTPLMATSAPAAPPLGPIGSPSSPTFSIWQPGQAQLVLSPVIGYASHISGAYTYSMDTAAWSPDGTLLWDQLSYTMRVEPAGHPLPSAQALSDFGLTAAPLLPVRDAGLQAIYDAMKATAPDSADAGSQTAQLAWRPDGRYVAAQPTFFAYPPPTDIALYAVRVFDCASGAVAATLTPPQPTRAPGVSAANMLRWSPDGAHLLLLDRGLREALVWSGASLPK